MREKNRQQNTSASWVARGERTEMWRKYRDREQGRSYTTLQEIVRLLQAFNPSMYTVETFAEEQLKGRSPKDATFIAEAFYGVLRYRPLLNGATQALIKRHRTEMTRKEEWLYMLIAYLLIFGCEELGHHRFAALIRFRANITVTVLSVLFPSVTVQQTCASSATFLLLRLLLDADSLAQYARPIWLCHYDASYIDATVIPGILQRSAVLAPFLESLRRTIGVATERLVKEALVNRGDSNAVGTETLKSASLEATATLTGKERGVQDDEPQHACGEKYKSVRKLLQTFGYGAKSEAGEEGCSRKESLCRAATATSLGTSRPSTADRNEERGGTLLRATSNNEKEQLTVYATHESTVAGACAAAEWESFEIQEDQSYTSRNSGRKQPKSRKAYTTQAKSASAHTGKDSSEEFRDLQEQDSQCLPVATCGKSSWSKLKRGGKGGAEDDMTKFCGSKPGQPREGERLRDRTREMYMSEGRDSYSMIAKDERRKKETCETEEEEVEEEVEDEVYLVKDVDAHERYLKLRFERASRRMQRKCPQFQQRALHRPSNLQKLLKEAEEKFNRECPFRPQRSSAPPICEKRPQTTVRFTTAEILRADSLLQKRQEEVYARLRQRDTDKRDERPFVKWQMKQKKDQEEQRLKNVARMRADAQLARAQGMRAASVAQRRRVFLVRAMKKVAAARQSRRVQIRQQEKVLLVQRAVAIRLGRHRRVNALEKVKERKMLHATAEKTKRALALTQTYKSFAEESLAKNSLASKAKTIERAALQVKNMVAALRRRRCRSLFKLSAPTLNGMCIAEAKARLKFLRAQRAEGVRRKREEILKDKVERNDELFMKATALAIKRQEDAEEANRRRLEARQQQQQHRRESQLRMEKALLQQRDKIWEKKQQQKNAKLRLATIVSVDSMLENQKQKVEAVSTLRHSTCLTEEDYGYASMQCPAVQNDPVCLPAEKRSMQALRIQQMKDEFLHTTKMNIEKRVQQQLIRGAQRRAIAVAEAARKEQVLADGIRKKAKYVRATNKANAELEETALDAARAEKLRSLRYERDEERERARRIISEAAALRRMEEKKFTKEKKAQPWYSQSRHLR